MGKPWCVLHKKYFSSQIKQYTVDENNYYWLKVSFEKIGSVVCQKCYDKKRDAVRLTQHMYLSPLPLPAAKNQQQIHFPRIEYDWVSIGFPVLCGTKVAPPHFAFPLPL